jgi:hypothetical protein
MTEYTFYQIECNGKRYVGSTIDFDRRIWQHQHNCCNIQSHQYNFPVYQYIRANGNWTNCKISILEKSNYETKRYALMREEYWRMEKEATLNSVCCFREKEEQKINKNKCRQKRYDLNKDTINLKRRQKEKQQRLKKKMLLELLHHATN